MASQADVKSPPATGAYETNHYRNLFAEIGKKNIDDHIDQAFSKIFYGSENERLYYPFSGGQSYIKVIDSDDIRSEGMSWGMIIAVQMDRKQEFDNLWRFAYQHMRNDDGTFAWQVKHEGNRVRQLDQNSAPDGELYFAAALFNAAFRWGNGSGVLNYEEKANELLDTIRNRLIHPQSKQIVFAPIGEASQVTDPSYHLPAFYEYWADVAKEHNDYWHDLAEISRNFLQSHAHQQTGLSTYLASFDGMPLERLSSISKAGNIYEGDAWRVAMNIGMDAHLFGDQQWHSDIIDRLYRFFRPNGQFLAGICGDGYSQIYYHDGSDFGTCGADNWRHGNGQIASNAAAALAAQDANNAAAYLEALWDAEWPTGRYRYYHGALHMLGLLHASGNFKLYKPSIQAQPPVDEPPINQPPVNNPPISEPPISEPPASEPPASEPPSNQVVALVQAEDFVNSRGIGVARSHDQNDQTNTVGWLDEGDWLAYMPINAPQSGQYTVEFRVSSPNDGGILELSGPYGQPYHGTFSIPNTGAWNEYQTIRHPIFLQEGDNGFTVRVGEGGWNLNWFRIVKH